MADTKEMVKTIYNALDSKKAIDITVLDITGLSVMADYFIIASADNTTQLNAMQGEVEFKMHELGSNPNQIEGNQRSTWILMDYEDVVVHLFSEEDRLFYNLERIWKDGKEININEL